MNVSKQVLDCKEQYWTYYKYLKRMSAPYFNQLIVIDSYQTNNQPFCFMIIPENMGSIYRPLIQQIYGIFGRIIPIQQLHPHCLSYLRTTNQILQQLYMINATDRNHNPNHLIILSTLFGDNYTKYQKLYLSFINNSQIQQLILNSTNINNFKSKEFRFLNGSRNKPNINFGYNQIIRNKLNLLPYQVGEARLQPLIQMSRQLNGIYGIQLTGSKLSQNHTKKILIKYSFPSYKKYKFLEKNQQQILQDIVNPEFIKNFYYIVRRLIHLNKKNQILHEMMKQVFLKSMCEKLMQIEIVTGKPYICLKMQNILFYNNQLIPSLSIDPYVIQALGLQVTNQEQITQSQLITNFLNESNENKLLYFTYYLQHLQKLELTQNVKMIKNQSDLLMAIKNKHSQKNKKYQTQLDYQKTESMMSKILNISSKKVPPLILIDQKLEFNSHISDMSPKKFEYVLWMRFKIVKFFLQTIKSVQNQTKTKCGEQRNKIDQLNDFQQQIQFYCIMLRLLLCLVSLQLRQILRPEDQHIKQQLFQYCDYNNINLIKGDIQNYKFSNKQKQQFLNQMHLLAHQLCYIQQNQEKKLLINYSKAVKKILVYLQKLSQRQKIQSQSVKLVSHVKQSIKISYFSYIYHINILMLLKIDHYNIFQCDYFYYRKLKKILNKQTKTKGEGQQNKKILIKLYNGLKDMEESEDIVWSGEVWPKKN